MIRLYGCAAGPPSRKGVSHPELRTALIPAIEIASAESGDESRALQEATSARQPFSPTGPRRDREFPNSLLDRWRRSSSVHRRAHRRRKAHPNRGGTRIQNDHAVARVVTHPATDALGAATAWHPGPPSRPCRALPFCGRKPSPPPFPDGPNRIRGKTAGTPGQDKPDPEKSRRDSRARQTGSGEKPPGLPGKANRIRGKTAGTPG